MNLNGWVGGNGKEAHGTVDIRVQPTLVMPEGNNVLSLENEEANLSVGRVQNGLQLPFTAGNYIATDILARGGMSTTYLGVAADDKTQKVVIKIPDVTFPKTVEMFENECSILADLQHSNIVPVLETGDVSSQNGDKFPYMVMKFITGQSLRQKLDTQGRLSWDEVALLLDDIGSALQYMFERKFCHRDVKPANIVFDVDSKRWILVDFGIAKSMQNNILATMTMVSQGSGTWDYMPPEQLEGKAVDIRCDIYALGTVAWEALIGTVPRRGTDLPAKYRKDLPADVDVLIKKMVEHDPNDRYQTPADVLQALHGGAQKIERKIRWRRSWKTVLKCTKWPSAVAAVTCAAWLIGNLFVCAEIRGIVNKHKNSPTATIREVEDFVAKMPLWLGHGYWNSIQPDLCTRAKKEETKMEEEFSVIKVKIGQTDGKMSEIKTRQQLCDNFLTKWGDIFKNVEEVRQVGARKKSLEKIIQEKNWLNDAIKEAESLSAGGETGQEDFRRAIEVCEKCKDRLTVEEFKLKIRGFMKGLTDKAVEKVIERVGKMCVNKTGKCLYDAYSEVKEVGKYVGDNIKLKKKLNEIDDDFWCYYSNIAEKALATNDFANARGNAEQYGNVGQKIGMSRNLMRTRQLLKKIAEKEEDYDWQQTTEYVDKSIEDGVLRRACEAVDKFVKKHPRTKRDIADYEQCMATRFADSMIVLNQLEMYQEQLQVFVEKFSMKNQNIPGLQLCLCKLVYNEIKRLAKGSDSASAELLGQIKYIYCDEKQMDYLGRLRNLAINYVKSRDYDDKYSFNYCCERPPFKSPVKPHTYWITITGFSYEMSDADYQDYKGEFDADIAVEIYLDYTLLRKIPMSVNTQAWESSSLNVGFWVDTKMDGVIKAGIVDTDIFTKSSDRICKFPVSLFSTSGEKTLWNGGTKISIKWATE